MANTIGTIEIQMLAEIARLQTQMRDAQRSIEQAMGGVSQSQMQVVRSAQQAEAANGRLIESFNAMRAAAAAIGLGAIVAQVKAVGGAILEAQINVDRFTTRMEVAGSGAGTAAKELEYVRATANRLGVGLTAAMDGYSKLAASSRGTAMEGEKTRATFEAISKAAIVMGMSSEQVSRLYQALGQMIGKGVVSMEEMRQQVGEHLPGAMQIAARAMGMTVSQLTELFSTGKLLTEDFLPRFAGQIDREMAGATEDASRRAQAEMNRFGAAWENLKVQIATSGVGDAIVEQLRMGTNFLKSIQERGEAARRQGAGQFGQGMAMASGALGWVDEKFTLLGALGLSPRSGNASVDELRAEIARLRAENPSPGFYMAGRIGQLEEELLNKQFALGTSHQSAAESARLMRLGIVPVSDPFAAAGLVAGLGGGDPKAQARIMSRFGGRQAKYDAAYDEALVAYNGNIPPEVLAGLKDILIDKAGGRDAHTAAIEAIKARYAFEQQLTQTHIEALNHMRKMGSMSEIEFIQEAADAEVRKLGLSRDAIDEQIALASKRKNSEGEVAKLEGERLKVSMQIAAVETKAGYEVAELQKKRKDAIAATIALQKQEDMAAWAAHDRERLDTWNRMLQTVNDYERAVRDSGDLLRLELGLQGESEQVRKKALADYQIELGLRNRILQIQMSGLDAEEQQALIAQARATAAIEGAQASSRIMLEEWQRTTDRIQGALYDAIVQGGADGWQAVQRVIMAEAANPFLTPVTRTLSGGISAIIGQPTSAAGSGSGVLGGLSNAGSALGLLGPGGMASYAATGFMNTVAGTGMLQGLSSAGALISGGAPASGLALGAGAIAPYALAAAALYAALSGGGERRYGAQYGVGPNGAFRIEGPSGGDANAMQSLAGINAAQQAIYDIASALGGSGGGQITRIGFEQSKYHNRRFNELFVGGVGMRRYGENADFSNDDVAALFAEDLQRSVLMGLQAAQLDRHFAEYLAKFEDAFGLSGEEIQNILNTTTAVKAMTDAVAMAGGVFQQFAGISVDARANIAELVGGFEAFNQKFAGYLGNYYSEEERAAMTARQLQIAFGGVGLSTAGLDSRTDYRALVDSLNVSTDLGQRQLAELLNWQQQFADLEAWMGENNRTINDLAAQVPPALQAMVDQISANELMVNRMDSATIRFADSVERHVIASQRIEGAAGEISTAARAIQQSQMSAGTELVMLPENDFA